MNRSWILPPALCIALALPNHVIHAQSGDPALFQPSTFSNSSTPMIPASRPMGARSSTCGRSWTS